VSLVDDQAIVVSVEIKDILGVALARNEPIVVPGPHLMRGTRLLFPDVKLTRVLESGLGNVENKAARTRDEIALGSEIPLLIQRIFILMNNNRSALVFRGALHVYDVAIETRFNEPILVDPKLVYRLRIGWNLVSTATESSHWSTITLLRCGKSLLRRISLLGRIALLGRITLLRRIALLLWWVSLLLRRITLLLRRIAGRGRIGTLLRRIALLRRVALGHTTRAPVLRGLLAVVVLVLLVLLVLLVAFVVAALRRIVRHLLMR